MKICVFGASSERIDSSYKQQSFELGKALAEAGHELIFGGGSRGLMGAVARGFKQGGGRVIGIAPKLFDVGDILLKECDEKIITEDMSSRKKKMMEMADAFIALPGGIGTYDELFEVMVEGQLEYHHKPIIVYNVNGFYDRLLDMLEHTAEEGFMRSYEAELYHVCDDCQEAVRLLEEKRL
ncbi:MAG: TIGR00730 family Rossman fold protein [Erysipelotrichaceae bacterium]|nr:TIGR00730 family Rossman fold protein [Erysipelotrichaceae bacterium]MBO4537623.1 TIGR00730 family Rossman fold protein [Erysipelotrichaceae bacterium]